MSQYELRKHRTEVRNSAMLALFIKLYEVNRIRSDDAYQQVADEFFLSKDYVEKIIRKMMLQATN